MQPSELSRPTVARTSTSGLPSPVRSSTSSQGPSSAEMTGSTSGHSSLIATSCIIGVAARPEASLCGACLAFGDFRCQGPACTSALGCLICYPCCSGRGQLSKHVHYITLHYITLHYITLHYITLHYITSHHILYKQITLAASQPRSCRWPSPPCWTPGSPAPEPPSACLTPQCSNSARRLVKIRQADNNTHTCTCMSLAIHFCEPPLTQPAWTAAASPCQQSKWHGIPLLLALPFVGLGFIGFRV